MKHLKSYVTLKDQEYYISTKNTFDVGFETMVFKSKDNYVTSWIEEFYKHYTTKEDAIKGHDYVVNNLEKCLKEGENQNWANETGINPFDLEHILKFLNSAEREGK